MEPHQTLITPSLGVNFMIRNLKNIMVEIKLIIN